MAQMGRPTITFLEFAHGLPGPLDKWRGLKDGAAAGGLTIPLGKTRALGFRSVAVGVLFIGRTTYF